MAGVKRMFLLIIFQGFYLGSGGQEWTFPSEITALIESCVEIPCTYQPDGTSGMISAVWYLYDRGYPEILNTKDSSSVMKEYKGRTSLVPGDKSCTLRIDPVREGDEGRYYPGMAEDRDINAWNKQAKYVHLSVTDSPGNIDLYVPENIQEEATIINCTAEHTCGSSPPSLQWNKPGRDKKKSVQISGGLWREESKLTYIPSYEDDGSRVRCTATYPNGQTAGRSGKLNIEYAATGVNITVKKGSEFIALTCGFLSSRPEVTHYTWRRDGSILHNETGKTLTIDNNEESDGQYSCIAHNTAGRSSSEEIHMKHEGSGYSAAGSKCNVVLLASLGTVCSLLLAALIASIYWRKIYQKARSRTAAEAPDPTYTDLVKKDIANEYEELKPIKSMHNAAPRGDRGAARQ